MEGTAQKQQQNLEPEQAAAKAALLAECDKLAAAGITFVAVHFDGYGDDGATEEVKPYDSEWYALGEREPIMHDASHLQRHIRGVTPWLAPSSMLRAARRSWAESRMTIF